MVAGPRNHSSCPCRLAIRAAKFGPKPTPPFCAGRKNITTESQHREKRGAIEGPIRIPLHSLLFLFNALAFPSIPSNSLTFRPVVFSIPTAPTNHLPDGLGLNENSRGQKGADKANDPVPCFFFSGASDNRIQNGCLRLRSATTVTCRSWAMRTMSSA